MADEQTVQTRKVGGRVGGGLEGRTRGLCGRNGLAPGCQHGGRQRKGEDEQIFHDRTTDAVVSYFFVYF